MLPIAAVNEQKGWPLVARLEKVDAVALAPAVSQVEMLGISLAHLGRAGLPIGDNVSASEYGLAIVETAVAIVLAHAAPVQRVERRRHVQISTGVCVCHSARKWSTGLANR